MSLLAEDGDDLLTEGGAPLLPENAFHILTEDGDSLLTEDGAPLLVEDAAPEGASLAGTATLTLAATGTLSAPAGLPAGLHGAATLRLTGSASLSVPARLAGVAALRLTGTGSLAVRATLAGFASLRLTAAGYIGTPGVALAGSATLRLTGGGVLTTHGTPLSGAALLTLTAVGDLTPSRAALVGRARLVLTAAGALVNYPELRALRSANIHRPVGVVEETSPGAARLNVLRFTLESSLDTPADGWTAEVAGAALMTAPNDEALYRLSLGLLDEEDAEHVAAHIASGRILDRRLVGRWPERRTYIRGLDALERTFRIRRRVRYVPEDGTVLVLESTANTLQTALTLRQAEIQTIKASDEWPTAELELRVDALMRIVVDLETGVTAAREAEVPEKVGTWTASAIAADLLVGTGLTVSWEVRDYTFAVAFDGVGTVYELIQRLADPWNQVPPLGVDVCAFGSVLRVRPRLLRPPADLTMTVAASRLVEIELGDRRRLPLIGTVDLEGRVDEAGSKYYHGEAAPGIGEPVLPVVSSETTSPFAEDTNDLSGNVIGRVEGTRTYRMPDKLLIAYTERVWQRGPTGLMVVVKQEQGTITYEPSHYGPHGPLNQPLPLSAHKLIDTLIPVTGAPAGTMTLGRTLDERQKWAYDDRRFLRTNSIERYKRHEAGGVVSFPLGETITETRTITMEGWVKLLVTRATYDPKTGKVTGSVTNPPQDQAGFPPGGPRLPFSFSTFISAPVREGSEVGAELPVRVHATISTDPTAVPLFYSNPNLTRADLEYILQQCRDASGLVEYPLRGNGPALPDIIKGSAVHLTDYVDADGTPIPLDPAQVRAIAFEYEDAPESFRSTCALEAVFYRRE